MPGQTDRGSTDPARRPTRPTRRKRSRKRWCATPRRPWSTTWRCRRSNPGAGTCAGQFRAAFYSGHVGRAQRDLGFLRPLHAHGNVSADSAGHVQATGSWSCGAGEGSFTFSAGRPTPLSGTTASCAHPSLSSDFTPGCGRLRPVVSRATFTPTPRPATATPVPPTPTPEPTLPPIVVREPTATPPPTRRAFSVAMTGTAGFQFD